MSVILDYCIHRLAYEAYARCRDWGFHFGLVAMSDFTLVKTPICRAEGKFVCMVVRSAYARKRAG